MSFEFFYDDIKVKNKKLISKGSLKIENAGITLIRGKNGVGKTLLLKNMYYNNSENVIMAEQSNNEIITELTVLENITMNCNETYDSKVIEYLDKLELEYLLKLNPKKMSGGEKRIVSLLRVLLSKASVIMMDEPTNDLDYRLVEKIINLIKNFADQKCFIIITHDDRLESIADHIFTIENQNLEQKYKEINKNKQNEEKKFSYEFNIENQIDKFVLIKNIFKKQYFSILGIILLAGITLSTIKDVSTDMKMPISDIHPRQVNIFIPISSMGSSILLKGACPIQIIDYIYSKDNIFNKSKHFSRLQEEVLYKQINYGLDLKSTDNYTVYPLEFYSIDENKHFFTLETYLSDILETDLDAGWIDTSEFFTLEFMTEIGKKYQFNKKDFNKSAEILQNKKTIKNKPLEIIYVTIILKENFSFQDFISQEEIQFLCTGNFYISSNETITLMNQINSFSRLEKIIRKFGIMALIVLLLEILYTYTYIYIKSNTIKILKNYGVKKNEVNNSIKEQFNDRTIRYIFTGIVLASNIIILSMQEKGFLIGGYILVLCYLVLMHCSHKFRKIIIKRRINKIYHWRYR